VTARRSLLLAAALLAACNKTSSRPSTRLNVPSAVAVFHGLTLRDPANLRAYLAVANLGGDDLRLLDAVDGKAVVAPGLIMSLSVPTLPRPALLAAGALPDAGGATKADLLVVAPTGLAACNPAYPTRLNGCIQVVTTWNKDTAVDGSLSIDLGDLLAPGDVAEVLSLAVVPVPVFDGTVWKASIDKARVVAGLSAGSSGGRLLLADFARDPGGVGIVKTGAAVHDLGFEAVSLSGAPDDPVHLYVASPDPVGQDGGLAVEGVAELDLSGPFDGVIPPARPLDAHAPTTAVLAARVQPFKALTSDPTLDEFEAPVMRVYAALEPTRCGRDQALACGLVTFDPVAGALIPDPAGQLPFASPVPVPGQILGLIAVYPPSVGSGEIDGTPAPDGTQGPLQKLATQTVVRWTSTLALATSTLGPAYLVDLARGGQALDANVLPLIRVSGALSTPTSTEEPYLALFDENAVAPAPALTRDPALMPARIGLTPGFTPTDNWTLGWQLTIPGLLGVPAQLQSTPDGLGLAWLALQHSVGSDAASGPLRDAVRLYDPRLGLRIGDIALVTALDATACSGGLELEVTDFLYPTADAPGGAVAVAPRVTLPTDAQQACLSALGAAGRSKAQVTFLSSELLLLGGAFGYAGRPTLRAAAAEPGYLLDWKDPAALTCPLLDGADATFVVGGRWQPPTCDLACRDTCQQLLLSRRSRRAFYVTDQCASTDTVCISRWGLVLLDNLNGPVVQFKVGLLSSTGVTLDPLTTAPARGATLTFTTVSGQVMSSRQPEVGATVTGMALPSGMATFDRAGETGSSADGVHVFVSYPSNQVLDCSPSVAAGSSGLYR
jgi:hypothetical protein